MIAYFSHKHLLTAIVETVRAEESRDDGTLSSEKDIEVEEENEELILGPHLQAFCEKENSNDEEDFICLTTFILQNAGKYHTANIFKKYLDNED